MTAKAGRPREYDTVLPKTLVTKEALAAVDRYAGEHTAGNRGEAVRRLLKSGLDAANGGAE